MNLDDEICYCYHVSMRKLVRFAQRTRPRCPSQMTECLGAGTGCGWCIPFLCRIAENPDGFDLADYASGQYAAARRGYIAEKKPRNAFASPPPAPPET